MKRKVWLTYAWKDNELDRKVDLVVQELEKNEIEVHLDRRDLIPGQPLWSQIGQAISAGNYDAWAILVSPNSLSSKACQEELAYALNRDLKQAEPFPLIGIIDGKFSSETLPASLQIRLCVSTIDPNWAQQVRAGANGVAPGVLSNAEIPEIVFEKFGASKLVPGTQSYVEVRPRVGSWPYVFVGVPLEEKSKLLEVRVGPRGVIPTTFRREKTTGENDAKRLYLYKVADEVSPLRSAYIFFGEYPSKFIVGTKLGDEEKVFHFRCE